MSILAGMRTVKVLENVTSGDLGMDYVMVEVTNNGGSPVKFFPNDYPEQGHPATEGIPVKNGETRQIPMLVRNFKASGAITIVAYGQ